MKRAFSVVAVLTLTACAVANYRPLVDTQGVGMNRYEQDLQACQSYAGQVAGAGTQAAVGAGIGAVLSGALAAIGGSRYDRGRSAAAGALIGGVSGAASGETD